MFRETPSVRMSYSYTLNAGQYVLMHGDSPVGRLLEEVSIALDKVDGTLHKHGSPESVQRWHAQAQQKLRAGGAFELADSLVVLTGRFPLEELNRCLSNIGYAGQLYLKAASGELKQLPYAAAPAGGSFCARKSAPRP
jgi:hypothetical protein